MHIALTPRSGHDCARSLPSMDESAQSRHACRTRGAPEAPAAREDAASASRPAAVGPEAQLDRRGCSSEDVFCARPRQSALLADSARPITAAAMQVSVRIQHVGPVRVPLPSYQTKGSAGLDLCAALPEPVLLGPGERRLIPAGLRLELPEGFEAQVRPRSGLALRHGLTVLNSPGTIDSDYRGELGILLINLGAERVEIAPLQRIAQLVIAPVSQAQLEVVATLSETGRAAGGYGSTGT